MAALGGILKGLSLDDDVDSVPDITEFIKKNNEFNRAIEKLKKEGEARLAWHNLQLHQGQQCLGIIAETEEQIKSFGALLNRAGKLTYLKNNVTEPTQTRTGYDESLMNDSVLLEDCVGNQVLNEQPRTTVEIQHVFKKPENCSKKMRKRTKYARTTVDMILETTEELRQLKEPLDKYKSQVHQDLEECSQVTGEISHLKEQLSQGKLELSQEKQELLQWKQELLQVKEELSKVQEELSHGRTEIAAVVSAAKEMEADGRRLSAELAEKIEENKILRQERDQLVENAKV